MSCVNNSKLSMRKIGDSWFVKHIPSNNIFELEGALAILWDSLLLSVTEESAKKKYTEYYNECQEARDDLPGLLDDLRKYGLLSEHITKKNVIGEYSNFDYSVMNNSEATDNLYRASLAYRLPVMAEFELTQYCNFRCIYCYQPCGLKKKGRIELSKEEITKMMRDFAESGVLFLSITGGECTSSVNLEHTIAEARKNYMDVTVLTNAFNINDRFIGMFLKYSVSDIKVSIYGSSEQEFYDFTGVKGAYTKVVDNVIKMHQAGLSVTAKIIVTSLQEKTYRNSMNVFAKLNIPVEVSCYVMPSMGGDLTPTKYRVSDKTLYDLMKEGLVKINCSPTKCTAGTVKFRVNPEGMVTPCELIRTAIGDVRKNKILDILDNKKNIKLTQKLKASNTDKRRIAQTWALSCPALSVIEKKAWNVPADESIRWTKVAEETMGENISKQYDDK